MSGKFDEKLFEDWERTKASEKQHFKRFVIEAEAI
jgi:hypothetical protein